jgi:hypothetical protein
MTRTRLYAPSDDTPGGAVARRLARLIGPALRAREGSVAAALLLGLGDALAAARARSRAALDEVFADTARETLSEWEALLGLPVREGASIDERRLDLVAKLRASFSASPSDIARMVRTWAPEARVLTAPVADALASDRRAVFRFALLLSATHAASSDLRARIAARLQSQAPAHAGWSTTSTAVFRCDSPDSLCDRDALGR